MLATAKEVVYFLANVMYRSTSMNLCVKKIKQNMAFVSARHWKIFFRALPFSGFFVWFLRTLPPCSGEWVPEWHPHVLSRNHSGVQWEGITRLKANKFYPGGVSPPSQPQKRDLYWEQYTELERRKPWCRKSRIFPTCVQQWVVQVETILYRWVHPYLNLNNLNFTLFAHLLSLQC